MRTLLISLFLLIVVAGFIVFYPGTVPYSLEVPGRVLPARQWILDNQTGGVLSATLYNHETGTSEQTFVTEFERGDAIQFNLRDDIKPGTAIAMNDTIGQLDSNEIERQIVQLRSQLNNQRALLSLSMTGEKEPVIEEARREVEHAREQFREQQNVVERLRRLNEENLIPYQEYEMAQSQLKLYEINVDIAEARLQSVSTGEKSEEIEMIRTQIQGLEDEIASLERRLDNYTILSPIDGVVYDESQSNDIINIGSKDQFVVIMPVILRSSPYVTEGRKVRCTIQGVDEQIDGVVTGLSNAIQVIRDEQMLVATATLDSNGHQLFPGTIVSCDIILEPVTLLEYIFRTVNTVFNR